MGAAIIREQQRNKGRKRERKKILRNNVHKKLHIAMDKSLAHTNLFQVCVIFRLERTCMSALDIDAKIDGSCVCVHV